MKEKITCELYFCPCGCEVIMRPTPLSPPEIEVLRALWQGKKMTAIAEERCVSVKTIEAQRRSLLLKAGLPTGGTSLVTLIRWGLKEGYLKL